MEEGLLQVLSLIEFALIVICVIRFLRTIKQYEKKQMASRVIRVTCRKCGNTFEGTQDSLKMGVMHKEVSTTRTKTEGAAVVNSPEYSSYARKVFCPYCQSMEWADIHDVNKIAEENQQAVRPLVIRLIITLIAINLAYGLLSKLVKTVF